MKKLKKKKNQCSHTQNNGQTRSVVHRQPYSEVKKDSKKVGVLSLCIVRWIFRRGLERQGPTQGSLQCMVVFRAGVLRGCRSLVHDPVEVVIPQLVLPVTEAVFEATGGCNRTLALQHHDVVQGDDTVVALSTFVANEDHLRTEHDYHVEAELWAIFIVLIDKLYLSSFTLFVWSLF